MTASISFVPLKSLSKNVPAGFRACRIIVKESGIVGSLKESMGGFIPSISNATVQAVLNNDTGADYLRACVEGIQDKVIRAALVKGGAVNEPTLDELFSYIEANEEGSVRLSKDSIGQWFDNVVLVKIQNLLMVSRNLDTETALGIAKNYKQFFVMAAEKSPSYPTSDVESKVKSVVGKVIDSMNEEEMTPFAEKIFGKLASATVARVDAFAL
jgi:uncharacterized protein YqgV (UPF0045/DUF77 family)